MTRPSRVCGRGASGMPPVVSARYTGRGEGLGRVSGVLVTGALLSPVRDGAVATADGDSACPVRSETAAVDTRLFRGEYDTIPEAVLFMATSSVWLKNLLAAILDLFTAACIMLA